MAMYEFDNRAAPADKREVLVNGKLYHYKTETKCTTCDVGHDRSMFAKLFINGGADVVIECPVCDTSVTTKTVLVKRSE